MRILLALVYGVVGLLPVQSQAMEIALRPDLVPRLEKMQWVYPAYDSNNAYATENPPFATGGQPLSETPVVYISGTIEKGDDAKLEAFMADNLSQSMIFILNSPGGNFLEALRIGERVKPVPLASDPWDWRFVVLQEDMCMSACSLILAMADGKIETGAKVGFHMGFLPEDQAQSSAQVQAIMNLTYDIVLEYTALIEDGTKPALLLREALKHRSSESFFVLNGGMRSWAMGFDPVSGGAPGRTINQVGFDHGTLLRVCQSLTFGAFDTLSEQTQRMVDGYGDYRPQMPDAGHLVKDTFDALNTDRIMQLVPGGPFATTYCVLERSETGLLSIGLYDEAVGEDTGLRPTCAGPENAVGWCAASGSVTTYVSTNLLADALGCSGGELYAKSATSDPSEWLPNYYDLPEKRYGTAKRDVNIRTQPGLGTQPIATLPQGTKTEITNCAMTGDRQGVWFEIKSGSYNGWVSARFLIEDIIFPAPVTN